MYHLFNMLHRDASPYFMIHISIVTKGNKNIARTETNYDHTYIV